MASPILKYFAFEHLPPNLQEVSRPIGELARSMDEKLPDGAEKSAGLRKLLEAKDCLVRALLPIILLALTLALSASPAHAAEPQQSFITKAQYEANVLPWGVGTNFVKDQDDRFWIVHKHMPPMQARVDGAPIFPLDEQMWNGVMLEHAKKKAKPAAAVVSASNWSNGYWDTDGGKAMWKEIQKLHSRATVVGCDCLSEREAHRKTATNVSNTASISRSGSTPDSRFLTTLGGKTLEVPERHSHSRPALNTLLGRVTRHESTMGTATECCFDVAPVKVALAAKPAAKIGGDWADGFDGLISVIEQAKEAAANGDPSLLADVRASLIANRAALKAEAK